MQKTKDQCRKCRREGQKLFLKGERCHSQKCAFFRRGYAPGEHGMANVRKRVSEYGSQLREKQKVKRIYGIKESQFRNYYKKADKKEGITGENLLITLELRLDNVLCRMGFAPSREASKQIIKHGHITINGKKMDIPSYLTKPKDKIGVSKRGKDNKYFKNLKESDEPDEVPAWITSDIKNLKGEVKVMPTRDDIDPSIEEQLIVELYSK